MRCPLHGGYDATPFLSSGSTRGVAIPRCVAIVLAAGSGSRSGFETNKVYADLLGLPLLSHSLRALQATRSVDDVLVVARAGEESRAREAAELGGCKKLVGVAQGGFDRTGSEIAGIEAIADLPGVDLVAIHDGARPFVTADLVTRLIDVARRHGGSLPGVPVDEPVFAVSDRGARAVDAALFRVQTPQVFPLVSLRTAYAAARSDGFSGADTAETVDRYCNLSVTVVPSDPRNIKVTYANDLAAAVEIAAEWSPERWKSHWL